MFKYHTKGVEYIRYTYVLDEVLEDGTGATYTQQDQSKICFSLPQKVRIERDLKKSNATRIEYWFTIRNPTRWQLTTGLREFSKNKFYGDKKYKQKSTGKDKKSLLLFQLSIDKRTLIVDCFRGYYPHFKRENILDNHKFKY